MHEIPKLKETNLLFNAILLGIIDFLRLALKLQWLVNTIISGGSILQLKLHYIWQFFESISRGKGKVKVTLEFLLVLKPCLLQVGSNWEQAGVSFAMFRFYTARLWQTLMHPVDSSPKRIA